MMLNTDVISNVDNNELEKLAKELWEVWAGVVTADILEYKFKIYEQTWDELPELHRKAWLEVARLVVKRLASIADVSFDLGKLVASVPSIGSH